MAAMHAPTAPAAPTDRSRSAVRVAVLDDHAAVRAGVRALIDPEPDLVMVGAAADEADLWPLLRRAHPSVLVLDFGRPGRDGLELARRVKAMLHPPRVVLHSGFPFERLAVASALAGVDAIASKSGTRLDLVQAIRLAAAGSGRAVGVPRHLAARAAALVDPSDHAILAMLLAGTAPADVADTLAIPRAELARRTAALVARLTPERRAAPADADEDEDEDLAGTPARRRARATSST
jgi:DNA-binding NarL/FixJ family response regulator